MPWALPLLAAILIVATGLSVWSAVIVRSRRSVPGSPSFAWLMLAVAHWCLMNALTLLIPDPGAQVTIAKVRWFAVAGVGPLWLLFTSSYARAAWTATPLVRLGVWIVPAITVGLALTNEAHGLIWRSVRRADTDWGVRVVQDWGPWLWVHTGYAYGLMGLALVLLAAGLRRAAPPYLPQRGLVVLGGALPVAGQVLWMGLWRSTGGPDLTPLALAASGLCFTWGLYRYRLFGLVPVARDLVVDSLEDGVMILDGDRWLIDLNTAAEGLAGCTLAQAGRAVSDIVPWWAEASAENRAPGLPAVVRTEPGPRFLEVRVSPVRDRERHFTGWLVVMRDITARRRAEADRLALERRIQEQQRSDSLTVFAAGVAHDFNNLLTGVLGNADLLAMQAPPDSAQRRTAEAIIIGAQRAADLVSKMLAYAGEGRVVTERVDLDTLVREMVDVMSASAARHCTLVYNSPGPLPAVEADPTQIRQVVLNLIINATEAVDEGGLVTVGTGRETLDRDALARMTFGRETEPGPYVFVDVVDNGHGMDDETLARVFEPFFSTKETGRGLGLAAVRGIVRSHQAALRVTSAPGQGTRVRVWLSLMPGRQSRPATR